MSVRRCKMFQPAHGGSGSLGNADVVAAGKTGSIDGGGRATDAQQAGGAALEVGRRSLEQLVDIILHGRRQHAIVHHKLLHSLHLPGKGGAEGSLRHIAGLARRRAALGVDVKRWRRQSKAGRHQQRLLAHQVHQLAQALLHLLHQHTRDAGNTAGRIQRPPRRRLKEGRGGEG